ncbi:MAG: hypothetical protein CHACPFDD_01507 [Phycisphaerae bacterium]|nr:hypothetical protein [Phycisphaerae bacterium]
MSSHDGDAGRLHSGVGCVPRRTTPSPADDRAVHQGCTLPGFRPRDSCSGQPTSQRRPACDADLIRGAPRDPIRAARSAPRDPSRAIRAATVRERFLSPAREPLDRSSQRFLSPARESLDRGSHPGSTQKPLADARGSVPCPRDPSRAARSAPRDPSRAIRAATVRERFLSPAREPLDRSSERFLSPARRFLDRSSHPGSTKKPLADARGSVPCPRDPSRDRAIRAARAEPRP